MQMGLNKVVVLDELEWCIHAVHIFACAESVSSTLSMSKNSTICSLLDFRA